MTTTRKNRQTGTRVTVISADEAMLCDGGGFTKWYTICEDHDIVCGHESRSLAQSFASSPLDWCDECSRTWRQQNNMKMIGD